MNDPVTPPFSVLLHLIATPSAIKLAITKNGPSSKIIFDPSIIILAIRFNSPPREASISEFEGEEKKEEQNNPNSHKTNKQRIGHSTYHS